MEPNTFSILSWAAQFPHSPGDLMALPQQFINDPTVPPQVVATLIAAVLVWLFSLFPKVLSSLFLRFLGWLGSRTDFTWLAVRGYLHRVEQQHGRLINIYLSEAKPLNLNQVFIPLTLRPTDAQSGTALPRSTRQILCDAEDRWLVLLGAAGSGKSTLLKALAAGVSRNEWPAFKNLVPVLLSLRHYAPEAEQMPLFVWLTEKHLPQYGLRNPAHLLANLLQQHRVLLLLDGLDEVAANHLASVNRRLTEFLQTYDATRQCRVLLTSREQNFGAMPDPKQYERLGFKVYRVTELRDAELQEMVMRRAADFAEHNKSTENYLRQIYLRPSTTQLHRTPLLLTLSMGLYLDRPGEEVPQNLAQFYEESIDNLLRRWDFRESEDLSANQFKADDKFSFLRYFARDNLKDASAVGGYFEEFR